MKGRRKMKLKKIIDGKTIKFIMVGVVNTIIGTLTMFVLYNFVGTNYWMSSAANYIVGSIVSYFLNKYFTFKSKEKSFASIIKFIINISVCYFVAYGVAKPLVYYVLGSISKSLQDNIAMLVGMCLFVVINYFGQRFWVFSDTDEVKE